MSRLRIIAVILEKKMLLCPASRKKLEPKKGNTYHDGILQDFFLHRGNRVLLHTIIYCP